MGVVSYKPRPSSAVCLKIDFLLASLQFWITFLLFLPLSIILVMRALYCLCMVLLSLLFHSPQVVLGQQCREILLNLPEPGSCPYNYTVNNSTVYPNPIINETTHPATVATLVTTLNQVLSNCSRDSSRFLCSALFPRCGSGAGPCLSLCEKIKRDCSSALVFLLNSFADVFNCTR